jgi:hypothetical protein
MAIIQVWSAPSCQTGAVCFGALAPWVSASGSEATGTPAGLRVVVPRDVADRASLAEGRCLRVLSQARGEQWWFVSSVQDSDGDAALVQVTAGPLRQLLTVRGLVRDGGTFAFTPGRITPADLLTEYVLTNLAADGLSWITLGTVDPTAPLEVGTLQRVTRAGVLDLIEQETGATARLRGLYTSGVLTGFALDVVADVAAGLDVVPLSAGLASVQRTRDALRAASVAVPFDVADRPMQQTAWVVDAVSGTAPAWITLRDVEAPAPWPIREDGQFVGAFLVQADGTATAITDSRASDSAVQVGAIGTLAVGAEVTLARDTAGRPVLEVTSPSAVAGPRGRLVGQVTTREPHGARNLVRNPLMLDWTAIDNPAQWQAVNSCVVGEYFRDTPLTWTALVNGAVAPGSFGVFYDGAVPGSRIYQSERVVFGGVALVWPILTSIADSTGAGSFLFNGATSPAIADNATITLTDVTRPASFPLERYQNSVMRFLSQEAMTVTNAPTKQHVRSASVRIATAVGTQVSVEAGWTFRNTAVTSVQNTDSGGTPTTDLSAVVNLVLPGVMLYDSNTSAVIGWQTPTEVPAGATVHRTVKTTGTVLSDTAVRVGLFPGSVQKSAFFAACRWVSLWIGDAEPDEPWLGSRSNQLFHRAQDVLASAALGTRYTVRGVDLTRLETENGALALGQSVRLRSETLGVDTTVRIVKLDYDFAQTETLNLELGAITPRLTGVTVTL